jgi:hypothetical protein
VWLYRFRFSGMSFVGFILLRCIDQRPTMYFFGQVLIVARVIFETAN